MANPVCTDIAENQLSLVSFPAEEEVHVWILPVTAIRPAELSETEASRAVRFRQPADGDRFGTGRRFLRMLAGHYLGVLPADVHIAGDLHQKPFLAHPIQPPLHFNLSHSDQVVLIAFAGDAVGIDVERIDPGFDAEDLIPAHFSPQEQAALGLAQDRLSAFYQLWTRKEALVKLDGTGLRESLQALEVLSDSPKTGPLREPSQLLSFAPQTGYAAALACNVSVRQVVFYRAI